MYCNQKTCNSISTDKNMGYNVSYFIEKLPIIKYLLPGNILFIKSKRGQQEGNYLPKKNVTKFEKMTKKVGTG